MAIQTRSSAARTHQRVTRSSSGRNKATEFARVRANVASLGDKLKNKELASLTVGDPSILRPSSTALSTSQTRAPYSLRTRDRGKAVVGSAVVKAAAKKRSGPKGPSYDGPGYSTDAKRSRTRGAKDCTICAENKKLYVFDLQSLCFG